ncbi:hypothetical protein [Oceanithermus sp.]|uniref:hypothetical protein n=1 Tax=Oceanithermus sp. TaxID=2268145 RepID=UPI0025CF0CF4|nr:hypothetical protein [Oceanithermus sp.]
MTPLHSFPAGDSCLSVTKQALAEIVSLARGVEAVAEFGFEHAGVVLEGEEFRPSLGGGEACGNRPELLPQLSVTAHLDGTVEITAFRTGGGRVTAVTARSALLSAIRGERRQEEVVS